MFWNDPNLYSVAFKDVPNFPNPFWGSAPRHFNPYGTLPVNPTPFTPPVTPFMHTNPGLPWLDRTMTPYNYNNPYFTPYANPTMFTPPMTPFMHTNPTLYNFPLPYFQGYRPFGL